VWSREKCVPRPRRARRLDRTV